MISGLSEESVQIREIQSILDGLFCVQGKEVAYGRKEGIAGSEQMRWEILEMLKLNMKKYWDA